MEQKPISAYATASDIAFTILVFEQYICRWKREASYRRESGKPMTEDQLENLQHCPLYYTGGIAGKEAKARFNRLHVYFYANFFISNSKTAVGNMKSLQEEVDRIGPPDNSVFELNKKRYDDTAIVAEVLHRVYYSIHV